MIAGMVWVGASRVCQLGPGVLEGDGLGVGDGVTVWLGIATGVAGVLEAVAVRIGVYEGVLVAVIRTGGVQATRQNIRKPKVI
jgi:hypothetical protein